MFNNDFCCCDVELVKEDEIINSYEGEFTYRNTYVCRACKKVFYIDREEYSEEEDFIEETNESEIENILENY